MRHRDGLTPARHRSGLPLLAIALFAAHAQPTLAATDRILRSDFEAGLSATLEQWTWEPFADAQCGDGSSVGIGVNLTTKSDRVLIYLEGGGACWSEQTCYGALPTTTISYPASQFVADTASTLALSGGFFDRTAVNNPFKDYSYVYVPYCTGDVHAGDNVVTYGTHTTHHVGFTNMTKFLAALADTFPNAGRIVLAGSSAGGLGATINWWQTQETFTRVRVDMINDSGAIMPADVATNPSDLEQTWRTQWNLAATLPPGCTACANSFDVILAFYASEFPNSRGALLSYVSDSVLPFFYGISFSTFSAGLTELETQQFDPTVTLKYFNEAGSGHVLWFSPTKATNGVTVQQFITQMVSDDPGWTSEKP